MNRPSCNTICANSGSGACYNGGGPYVDGCGNNPGFHCDYPKATLSRTCDCRSYCANNNGEGCTPGYTKPAPNCTWPTFRMGPDACECYKCSTFSPIVINLAGPNAPSFSAAEQGVDFDILANGTMIRVAWPNDGDGGWLVLDRNGNGVIDNGGELFGTSTRLSNGPLATHGYQALADLDGNGDGRVDSADPMFNALRLWRDVVRDGLSAPDELYTMAAVGISSLSTQPRESGHRDEWGNMFAMRARIDGPGNAPRNSFDVYPKVVPGM